MRVRKPILNLLEKCFMASLCQGSLLVAGVIDPTPPVLSETLGATIVTLAGHAGSGSEKLTFISLQLIRQGAAQGVLTSTGTMSLTDAAANGDWSNDQFNGANGSFFVEITSGAALGSMSDIADTADTGILTTSDDLSAQAAPPTVGDTYAVRPHVTFDALIPNGGGLLKDPDVNVADNVLVVTSSGTVATFFHNGTNWRQAGAGIAADDTTLMPEKGLILRRRQALAVDLTFFGIAKEGATVVPVEQGFNLLGALRAASAVALKDLGLYTGSDTTGVVAGSNPTKSDNLLIIQPSGAVSRYFYFTGSQLLDGWYDPGYTAAGEVLIQPGTSFYIERKSGGSFNWSIPAQ
ncbi:MAG: hypothetical protein ACI957_001534 [Verrucomicrobiales bacterium]|jgi:uncharacterized protein (TIGR02597 family)